MSAAFVSMCPKTAVVPYPLIKANDPDQLRTVALEMEDVLAKGDEELILERPGLIFMRTVLLNLADRIERYG